MALIAFSAVRVPLGLALARRVAALLTAAAMSVASASVGAQADAASRDGPAFARIAALEQSGRADPKAAIKELESLRRQTTERSDAALEALTVEGLLLASAADAEGIERIATLLESWGSEPDAPAPRAAALLVRAQAANLGGRLSRADRLAGEALALLPADATALDRWRFLNVHAVIKDNAGLLQDAVRIGHEAVGVADALGERWRQVTSRVTLTYSYLQANQIEQARRLSDETIKLAEASNDEVAISRAYNSRSIVLDSQGETDGERAAIETAITHARRAGAKIEEALFIANLADFYLKRGDFPTALKLAEQSLPIVRELKDLSGETVALANIGLALVSMKQFADGKRYLEESIAIDERRGAQASVAQTLEEMGGYLERAGDPPGAVEAYHRARRIGDEMKQREQQVAVVEMQEQFDNERRMRELELLSRDNRIKTEQLHRRELQQRGWLLLAAICSLSIGLVALQAQRTRWASRALASDNEQLKEASERDPLTGLANRRHLQQLMRSAPAEVMPPAALFLVDIDSFKQINDQHGHAAGDAVLIEVARRLRLALRAPDLLVRWGGEEFVVVVRDLKEAPGRTQDSLPALTGLTRVSRFGAAHEFEQAEALAQRMLDEIGDRPITSGVAQPVTISASIGFASFPLEPNRLAVSWGAALHLVDTAMYLAKAHGRNRAYGVRLVLASSEAALALLTPALEEAWRAGSVALTSLHGPRREGQP